MCIKICIFKDLTVGYPHLQYPMDVGYRRMRYLTCIGYLQKSFTSSFLPKQNRDEEKLGKTIFHYDRHLQSSNEFPSIFFSSSCYGYGTNTSSHSILLLHSLQLRGFSNAQSGAENLLTCQQFKVCERSITSNGKVMVSLNLIQMMKCSHVEGGVEGC